MPDGDKEKTAHRIGVNAAILSILLFAIIIAAGCIELKDMSQRNLTGSLYGTVTNLEDDPLENASVVLIGDAFNYSCLTDAGGNYNISGVPEGTYNIVVWKAGYTNETVADITIFGGDSIPWDFILFSSIASLYGTVTNLKKVPLEDATISIISDAQNYSGRTDKNGKYDITGIQLGTYGVLVQKAGYRNMTLTNFTITMGYAYPWNATIARDCSYYLVNASTDYVLRYGYNGTIYRGEVGFAVAYPEGATYEVHPAADGGLSEVSTVYQAGNRMLRWKLDNSEGRYSYVEGRFYINMNGTGTMQIYDQKEIGIRDAASRQPGYLGSETTEGGKKMIDPSNPEIMAIAQRVKNETGSDDTWTVARALFLWLKNNTAYYKNPEISSYTNLPIETLHSGRGKCDELSHLYVSMLRVDDIPARFVKGYLAERNPDRYVAHEWVEFYDGEWVPVEVAGSGTDASDEADTEFAVRQPDHVGVFTDDGTDEAISERYAGTGGYYYDQPDTFTSDSYYDAVGYNQMYIAACSDGTRGLKQEEE